MASTLPVMFPVGGEEGVVGLHNCGLKELPSAKSASRIHSALIGVPDWVDLHTKATPYLVVPDGRLTRSVPLFGKDAEVQLPVPIF